MYKVGCAKQDITTFAYNKGMMGYAIHFHVAKGVKTPLYARAFVIEDEQTGKKVVIVNAEICFYSIAVKDAVAKELSTNYPHLGFNEANIMLTAQHTHSGPGGYSHYILYNLAIPGFQTNVFNDIVAGTVAVIVAADANKQKASLQFAINAFAPEIGVAFNRSLKAYNANPEVKQKVLKKDHHLAIDRRMKMLRFNNNEQQAIGAINWFGVHTTSVGNKHNKICYDNKGYAAEYMERHLNPNFDTNNTQLNFIGAFAQDTAGDVSPNNQHEPPVNKDEEYESAAQSGYVQFKQAAKLLEQCSKIPNLEGGIDYELMYADLSNVHVASEFVMGMTGKRTAPAAIGFHLLMGASDRPALSKAENYLLEYGGPVIASAIKLYEKTVLQAFTSRKGKEDVQLKYNIHGSKKIVIETGRGKVMGTYNLKNMVIPSIDKTIAVLKRLDRQGYSKRTPWMPRILPLQIFCLGELAIVGIPAELTTIAGKRMHDGLLRILKHRGIKHIVLSTYANGYSGYITTSQEYDTQMYEGAHTIFGKWTLGGYQTKLKELAIEMLKPAEKRNINRNIRPDIFKKEEIWLGE